MQLTLSKIRIYIAVLILVLSSFAIGFWVGEKKLSVQREGYIPKISIDREVPEQFADVDFALFWQVWEKLEMSYFDKSMLDKGKMVHGAIAGMVSAVGDPYTVFLPPEDQKRSKEDLGGNFEGVGIQIGYKGTQLAVIAPLDGSPASRANVKAGDYIVGIKDTDKNLEIGTLGLSLPDAVDHIRGKAGTLVTLVLTRENNEKPFEVEIVRGKIDVPSIILTFEDLENGKKIANLKLMKFGDQTNGEWSAAISKIKKEGAEGMILDVRNNPGGYLNGAVSVVSEFLARGVAVKREDGNGNKTPINVLGKAQLPDITLVVLVNKGSASASEIVAGALKDQKRAKIVGSKTFGKGTIQESVEIGPSGLHITTERWLTPNEIWVNTVGLTPDAEIDDNPDTDVDEQLEEALKIFK